jgi:hypothetical protein
VDGNNNNCNQWCRLDRNYMHYPSHHQYTSTNGHCSTSQVSNGLPPVPMAQFSLLDPEDKSHTTSSEEGLWHLGVDLPPISPIRCRLVYWL